ncbi:MAG TPA: nickel-type superoxide dismutase maturation protease [Methylomirabilota bacterium]|nr:nickel-type superoxide dismutase maturation protease [Methylomirabilota bacterium]
MPTGRGVLLLLALIGVAVVARRWVDVVEVRGRSMAPALQPGDRLLVVRALRTPQIGDVVLARDPREPGRELIKRVADVVPQGVVLHGDNPSASTDARIFGALPAHGLQWHAVARYWPPGRMGWLGMAMGFSRSRRPTPPHRRTRTARPA